MSLGLDPVIGENDRPKRGIVCSSVYVRGVISEWVSVSVYRSNAEVTIRHSAEPSVGLGWAQDYMYMYLFSPLLSRLNTTTITPNRAKAMHRTHSKTNSDLQDCYSYCPFVTKL